MSSSREVLDAFADSTSPSRRTSAISPETELPHAESDLGETDASIAATSTAQSTKSLDPASISDISQRMDSRGPAELLSPRSRPLPPTPLEVSQIVDKFRALAHVSPALASPSTSLGPVMAASVPTTAGNAKAAAALGAGSVTLSLNWSPGIALLRLNNPSKRNAISAPMIAQFADSVTALETIFASASSPLVAVVVTGIGRNFCSGFDLDLAEMIGTSEAEETKRNGFEMSVAMGDALRRLRGLDLISVAVVDGYAIGGGAEIATACDFRILTDQASIRFVHIKIGLVPAWGGATYLSTLLGPRIALRFLSTTGRIDLEAAETIGFADRCVSTNPIETDEEVLSHAIRFLDPMVWTNPDQPAAKRVAHPAAAVRASKRVIQQKRARDEAESLEEERSVFVELWGGREMREAIGTRRKHG